MSARSGVTESGRLTFCVGLPHSGKSTYCNRWVREAPLCEKHVDIDLYRYHAGQTPPLEVSRPRVIVAGDDFRHAIHANEYIVESEGLVFATMDVAIRALLRRGHDVIVDETCTTQATLLRYLKIDLDAQPVFIDTPAEECIRRARANGRDYLVGPIERMAAQLADLKAGWDATVEKLKGYVRMRQGMDVAV